MSGDNNTGMALNLSRWIDVVVRFGPAVAFLSLASAFIYDGLYWQTVDRRVLGLYVLSDHIETAAYIVIFQAVTVIWFGTMVPVLMVLRLGPIALSKYRWYLYATLALTAVFGFGPVFGLPVNLTDAATVITIVAAVWLALRRSPPLAFPPVSFLQVAIGWIALVAFSAILHGKIDTGVFGNPPRLQILDRVELTSGGSLEGHVLRIIDRGIVLRDQQGGSIRFIGKEQASKVILRVGEKSGL
jgi:hypothetical protein